MSKDVYKSWIEYLAAQDEEISIVEPDTEPDNIDVIVCRLAPGGVKLMMPDNLLGHCSKCFRMVQFRPHAPKLPRRICDECIRSEIDQRRKEGEEVKFSITPNTALDLAVIYAKKKQQ